MHTCTKARPMIVAPPDVSISPSKRFVTPEGFGDGVSVRGDLINPPNIVMDVGTPRECESICQNNSECQYFTWGDWGACALYATASDFRRDAQGSVISGARELTQELDWSLLVTNKFSHTETRGGMSRLNTQCFQYPSRS